MQGILGVKKASLFGKQTSNHSRAGADINELTMQRHGVLDQLNPLSLRLSGPSKIKGQGYNLKESKKQAKFEVPSAQNETPEKTHILIS